MKRTLGYFVGLLLCVSPFVPFLVEAQSGNQSDAELASLLSVIQSIVQGLKQQVQQLTGASFNTAYAQTTSITIGDASVLSQADNGNGNLLVAQSTTLSQTATIQSLSFYVTTAAGNLRLGIYDASGPGGGPGAKKAETNSFTPVVGWNIANVITPLSLSAGTYWLAYLPSSNTLAFVKTQDSSSNGKYYSFTYGTLPATFSTTPNSTASHWSFYATLSTTPDTQAPSTPTNLSATAISSSQIDLSWTASTDNVGVTTYRIYRAGSQIASPSGTSYSDTGLSPSTSYSYTAAAVDGAGNVSPQSSSVSATTQAPPPPDTTAPSIPLSRGQ